MTSCNTALVIDQSSSLGTQFTGSGTQIRNLGNALIDALIPGNGKLAIATFNYLAVSSLTTGAASGNSSPDEGYFIISSQETAARDFLDTQVEENPLTPGTLWDLAFQQVLDLPTPPDTFIFFTDGNPNAGHRGLAEETAIKANGTRIIGVGVGNIAGGSNEATLREASSNSTNSPGGPILGIDYFVSEDISGLADITAGILANGFGCIASQPTGENIKFSSCICSKNPTLGELRLTTEGLGGNREEIISGIVKSISDIIEWNFRPDRYIRPTVNPSFLNRYFYDQSGQFTREEVFQSTLDLFLKTGVIGEVRDPRKVKKITYIVNEFFNPVAIWLRTLYKESGNRGGECIEEGSGNNTLVETSNCIGTLHLRYG